MAVDVTHAQALGGASAEQGIEEATHGVVWMRAFLVAIVGLQIAWTAALAFGAIRSYGLLT